ncbi:MAG: hypothetical protein JWQ27_35 [Ferruginibacter sp.]|nr:hypothetical protein [Ferruginibacter sp.]
MKTFLLLLLPVLISSCSTNEKKVSKPLVHITQQQKVDTIAVFTDSTTIAIPQHNKIRVASIEIDDSITHNIVRFYAQDKNIWKLKYSFQDEHWVGMPIYPEITDFNNDGYKDFQYLESTGGRGGNAFYNLFIYDKSGDSLVYIQNSIRYPNLYFNKATKSINSIILTRGVETVFLHLHGNMLKPFASIFQIEKLVTVKVIDNNGHSKIIQTDSSGRYPELARFTNYKPLIVEE